jgi:hypothetical protein
MVTARRGAGSGGCLFMVALFAAAVVYGWPTAKVYLRAYEYEDAMRTVLVFGKQDTDDGLKARVRAAADSIGGLPDDAYDITVDRYNGMIRLRAEYTDTIKVPLIPRAVTHRFTVERAE